MSTGAQETCYWVWRIHARNSRIVQYMFDDMFYLTYNGKIVAEAYEENKENPKEFTIWGYCANLDEGLGWIKRVFAGRWRGHMNSGILYYVGVNDGQYGIIKVLRCKDYNTGLTFEPSWEGMNQHYYEVFFLLTLRNNVTIENMYVYFYQYKCNQLFEWIDAWLKGDGITDWVKVLSDMIMDYVFLDEKHCFIDAPRKENEAVCLKYAKTHDKPEFTKEHAQATVFAALLSYAKDYDSP